METPIHILYVEDDHLDRELVQLLHTALPALHPEPRTQLVIQLHQVGAKGNVVVLQSGLDKKTVPMKQQKAKQFQENVAGGLGLLAAEDQFVRQGPSPVLAFQGEAVLPAHQLFVLASGAVGACVWKSLAEAGALRN